MRFLILLSFLSIGALGNAQSDFYDIHETRDIRLYFQQTNWDNLLDSLYIAGDEERILASVVLDGTRFDSVGVRYKGFSSVSTERKKNPFNIKLDYVKNQSYQGYEKLKLSNVIQDPSFVREALSYEIARQYMPASKANFANVYINDIFWGVYTNVEAVNKHFLADHFSSSSNAFFKGNPDDLDLNGENSNLSNSLEIDSSNYFHLYDMKSDDGWNDLMELIDVLNDTSKEVQEVLNIDQSLWMHAFNYTFINFDSYIGYAQNYYLYRSDNGLFNPILWDLNQSFGSFRLTDASLFFQGFSVNQAKNLDPLAHLNSISVQPRPLIRNILQNDTYKRMYLAHIRTMVKEQLSNENYYVRAQEMQQMIQSDVFLDPNKFYSNTAFLSNLDTTVKDLIEYPGIRDLMEGRRSYLLSYPGMVGYPILIDPNLNVIGDSVDITIHVDYGKSPKLFYRPSNHTTFYSLAMLDDGLHGDGAANDQNYGVRLPVSVLSQYYFYAENDSAGTFKPERAAHEFYTFQSTALVINELCASNGSIVEDEFGEYDDWVELFNNNSTEMSLSGLYLSDDIDQLNKWPLPNINIEGQGYTLFWLDGEPNEGELHANFKLSASGEEVYLSNGDGEIIDNVSFGIQNEDVTYGRIPNGSGSFATNSPTPLGFNQPWSLDISAQKVEYVLYPNPASTVLRTLFNQKVNGTLTIFHINSGQVINNESLTDAWAWNYDVSSMVKGMYILRIVTHNDVITKKFILK
jgi:spore coat protein CotH